MKSIMYKTSGTCSQFVEMEADENNVVTRAVVIGGCNGNLQGICKLITGMRLDDVKAARRQACADGRQEAQHHLILIWKIKESDSLI